MTCHATPAGLSWKDEAEAEAHATPKEVPAPKAIPAPKGKGK
jgi:hypothetical protein